MEAPLSELEFRLQVAHFLGREVHAIAGATHRGKLSEFLERSRRYHREIGAGGYVCEDPLDLAARRLAAFIEGFEARRG